MTIENALYVGDLNPAYPEIGDGLLEGDDHIRMIKAASTRTFPNVKGQVIKSHLQLNAAPHDRAGVISLLGHEVPLRTGTQGIWFNWIANKLHAGLTPNTDLGGIVFDTAFTGGNYQAGQSGFKIAPNGHIEQWGFIQFLTDTAAVGSVQQVDFALPRPFSFAEVITGVAAGTGVGSSGNEDIEHNMALGFASNSIGRIRIMRTFGAQSGGELFGFFFRASGR